MSCSHPISFEITHTCIRHHQSPLHISSYTRCVRRSEVQCRSGAKRMHFLNRLAPMSSRTTARTSRKYTMRVRLCTPSPTDTSAVVHLGPLGNRSMSRKRLALFFHGVLPLYYTTSKYYYTSHLPRYSPLAPLGASTCLDQSARSSSRSQPSRIGRNPPAAHKTSYIAVSPARPCASSRLGHPQY